MCFRQFSFPKYPKSSSNARKLPACSRAAAHPTSFWMTNENAADEAGRALRRKSVSDTSRWLMQYLRYMSLASLNSILHWIDSHKTAVICWFCWISLIAVFWFWISVTYALNCFQPVKLLKLIAVRMLNSTRKFRNTNARWWRRFVELSELFSCLSFSCRPLIGTMVE